MITHNDGTWIVLVVRSAASPVLGRSIRKVPPDALQSSHASVTANFPTESTIPYSFEKTPLIGIIQIQKETMNGQRKQVYSFVPAGNVSVLKLWKMEWWPTKASFLRLCPTAPLSKAPNAFPGHTWVISSWCLFKVERKGSRVRPNIEPILLIEPSVLEFYLAPCGDNQLTKPWWPLTLTPLPLGSLQQKLSRGWEEKKELATWKADIPTCSL